MDTNSLKDKIWDRTILFEEIDEFFIGNGDKSEVIIPLLEVALNEKNGSAVEYLLYAVQKNGISTGYENVFCKILEVREDWMYKHEDVAALLGKIGSDSSVEHLCRLVEDYETSDIHDIPSKAIWALYDVGTTCAIRCLRILSNNNDPKKAKIARQLISYIDSN